jgi:Flp pilus assembly protein TadG
MHTLPPRTRQRGTATVEFALTLPVLLLLMLSTIDIGRMLSQYNILTGAVRNACRYAASNATTGSTGVITITQQLQSSAANLGATGTVGGSGTSVLPGLNAANFSVTDAGSGYISVSASYPYQPLIAAQLPTFGLAPPISLTITLRAQTTMRAL